MDKLVLSTKTLSFSLESGCKSTNFFSIGKYFFSFLSLTTNNQQNIFSSPHKITRYFNVTALQKKQKSYTSSTIKQPVTRY